MLSNNTIDLSKFSISFNPYLGSYEAIDKNGKSYFTEIHNKPLLSWICNGESLKDYTNKYLAYLIDNTIKVL